MTSSSSGDTAQHTLRQKPHRPAARVALLVALIAVAVVVADQALKIWVKTSFYLGEDLPITDWFHLKFIENNGMAFGMQLTSKIVLTLGRILAVGLFIFFVAKVRRLATLRTGFFVSMALIIAGAAGNIFDCVFYGVVFNDPMPPALAEWMAPGGGYSTWFEGRVVDMLYFPLFTFTWPDWMPAVGGTEFEFFQYIFNIADSAICVGVLMLICFYSSDLSLALASLGSGRDDDSRKRDRLK